MGAETEGPGAAGLTEGARLGGGRGLAARRAAVGRPVPAAPGAGVGNGRLRDGPAGELGGRGWRASEGRLAKRAAETGGWTGRLVGEGRGDGTEPRAVAGGCEAGRRAGRREAGHVE
jgi:hypothetical protein